MSADHARAIHVLVTDWVAGTSGVLREGLMLYLERWAEVGDGHGTALMPVWIGESLTGALGAAFVPIGAATWASWMAADLLDEAADRELAGVWRERFGDAATDVAYTAAAAMFAFAPLHVLAAGGVAGDVQAELERLRGAVMIRSGSGHADDLLAATRPPVNLAAYEDHLRLKCGEHLRYQLLAALPLARRLAAVPPGVDAALGEAAVAIAMAGQLADDLEDLSAPIDHDTLGGRATWPLWWARAHAPSDELEAAWRRARDPDHHAAAMIEVRRRLAAAGAFTAITLRIERHVLVARRALAGVAVAWVAPLHVMLDRMSPLARLRARVP